jgi:hypothetical protein
MTAQPDRTLLDAIAERLVDPIAERVVEIIRQEGVISAPSPSNAWLNAADVARLLCATREWGCEHADELGAVRIGNGRRPRLRFPRERLVGGHGTAHRRTEESVERHRRAPHGSPPSERTHGGDSKTTGGTQAIAEVQIGMRQ